MNQWIRALLLAAISLCVALCVGACATDDTANNNKNDVRQQVEAEFGPLSDEQIAGFEREIAAQYRQLQIHYAAYDEVRLASPDAANNDYEEHRLHRKLKRRHMTLARLHEDRMWLHLSQDGPAAQDRQLAEAHRAAARWHGARYDDDGLGVEHQDTELEVLRSQFEDLEFLDADAGGADPRS